MLDTEDATKLYRLGKYRIDGLLGQGAMGLVYKAFDTVIERFVALKTIRAELLAGDNSAEWLARFKREVQAAGRCLHPNIVTIFEYGEDRSVPYIVMEYIEGRELKHSLQEGVVFAVKPALRIIAQVLDALSYAHEHGIVHRDIKPSNIILLADGHVKVTDFGIACLDASHLTQYGMAIGTPDYMAPEQFTGGQITAATDLYTTGLVLFELVSGTKPFAGKSPTEILYQILHGKPKDIVTLNPQVPAGLQAVLHKALAKNPDERFQTAKDFRNALVLAVTDTFREENDKAGLHTLAAGETPDSAHKQETVEAESAARWAPEILREAEAQLTLIVGPVARVILKKASRKATTVEELYQTLASNISTEADKKAFLEKRKRFQDDTGWQQPAGTAVSQPGQRLDPRNLEKITRELTLYLGPIAKLLVRKTAAQASSSEELCRQLSLYIPNENERATFLKKTGS
ncbi:MAG: serine/threonine-protein kinase [Candidatus Competibacteraceae bacterium]